MTRTSIILRTVLLFGPYFVIIQATHTYGTKCGEDPQNTELPDEKIVLDAKGSRDHLIIQKYTLIAFRRIMECKLQDLRSQEGGLFQNFVSLFDDMLRVSEKKILNENLFPQLIQHAVKLLENYKKILLRKRDYCTQAYDYRLLQWLKIHMRKGFTRNESLEFDINALFVENGENYPPKNILQYIFPKWDIEGECNEIKSLNELKVFGYRRDKAVEYCLLLVKTKGEAAKNTEIKMPFCNDAENPYENFLRSAYPNAHSFQKYIGATPGEVLAMVYDAAHTSCTRTPYQRGDASIRLSSKTIRKDRIRYYRQVLTLFDHAMESILHERGQILENTFDEVLQLENFPLDRENMLDLRIAYEGIRISAIESLTSRVIEAYNKEIIKLQRTDKLSQEVLQSYGRLLDWLAVYLKKIYTTETDIFHRVKEIRKFHLPDMELIPEEVCQQVITLQQLVHLYKTGSVSPSNKIPSPPDSPTESNRAELISAATHNEITV